MGDYFCQFSRFFVVNKKGYEPHFIASWLVTLLSVVNNLLFRFVHQYSLVALDLCSLDWVYPAD